MIRETQEENAELFELGLQLEKQNTENDEYIMLPLISGGEYKVTTVLGYECERMFPNINVAQEFCAMRVWLECNPTRRKTKRGIRRFVASWLIRATHDAETPLQVRRDCRVGRAV